MGPGDLPELQMISRSQGFIPLEKMAALEGELYPGEVPLPKPTLPSLCLKSSGIPQAGVDLFGKSVMPFKFGKVAAS